MKNIRLKGFSLIEILVYMTIFVVVFLAISSFFIWIIKGNIKNKVMREVLDNGRRAMEMMTYEIKEAKGVYSSTTTSNQLSLETKKYLAEGESASYIDFYICDKQICLKKESQGPVAITSDRVEVDNLSFTLIGEKQSSVQINLKISFKNPTNRPEYRASIDLTSTASLRN